MPRPLTQSYRVALLAGAAAALVVMTIPVGALELLVSSTGVSEAVPAAAPPLGMNARMVLAGLLGLLMMGMALVLHRTSQSRQNDLQGDNDMGFAFSKLTAFARSPRRMPQETEPLPVLRRADAHPDAPARRPIFASQDFNGTDIFTQPLPAPRPVIAPAVAFEDDIVIEDGAGLAMPRSPDPLPDEDIIAHIPEAQRPVRLPLDDLTIGELTDRFEQSFARRTALAEASVAADRVDAAMADTMLPKPIVYPASMKLADIPAASPVPVRRDLDAEIDEALSAALGTLAKMTARGR